MQIPMVLFFVLFGALGLYVSLRGERNAELWLVMPPVLLSVAFGAWTWMSADAATGYILAAMLWIFASSAAGALIGLGIGRAWNARRAV